MKTTTTTRLKPELSTIEKLSNFVNQRPGLEFANYGDYGSYRREMAEIGRDRMDYRELLGLAFSEVEDLDTKLSDYLKKTSGRLSMNESRSLEYCTGQYFPTEYRPAACRVLASIIWCEVSGRFQDGHEIRKYLGRKVSRRVKQNYFN